MTGRCSLHGEDIKRLIEFYKRCQVGDGSWGKMEWAGNMKLVAFVPNAYQGGVFGEI